LKVTSSLHPPPAEFLVILKPRETLFIQEASYTGDTKGVPFRKN
jgi:hypothetical protein